ncbi:MAG: nucleotidyltransferase family protein, partial [Lachnospiraceae bacterium]|nr:nucleotidyltransferase family protein [Lachnospiraceae bacterium]
ELSPYIPERALRALTEEAGCSWMPDAAHKVREALSAVFLDRIWAAESASDLTPYLDLTPDLARTIMKKRPEFRSMEQFASVCASKSLTVSHAARAVLHIALGLKKTDPGEGSIITQLIGANVRFRDLLSVFAEGSVPVIVRPSAPPALSGGEEALLREEIRLSNLYEAVSCMAGNVNAVHEMARGVVWV